MKTLHIYTEEPSMKNVLEILMPKILPENVEFRIYPHEGKQDLEIGLRKTIPKISKNPETVFLITRDKDSGNCKEVKRNLMNILNETCNSPFLVRIVCTELECWFLGDLNAIQKTYPRFKPEQYQNAKEFRDVDAIQNAPKKLQEMIPELTKKKNFSKLLFSESIANHLDIENNKSLSFQHFISGVRKLIGNK